MLDYLARAGISKEQVARGGYLIRTTLDPDVQVPVKSAIDGIASPDLEGIASVMSVIRPGKDSHPVLAMASNRTYGLNTDAGETMQPQPFSLVGDGAGSTFKIFTTAAALEMGMGINAQLDVPGQFQAKGLGSSDTPGCPKETWCVKNAGSYRGSMNVTDALATSPNTAFAKLITQVGVQRSVDMAVKLGLRSYALPGTARDYDPESNESLADFIKRQNIGSFTLGPFELNALEFSNVAATLASGGVWCPPNPIDKVFDRNGKEVCGHHRDLRTGGARGAGQHAGQRDEQGRPRRQARPPGRPVRRAGTCRCPARPAPPRRTARRHSSASPTRWRRPTTSTTTPPTPGDLCSFPLRQCGSGNLFGGNEPARTWFTAMKPIANNFGEVKLPPTDPRYVDGAPGSRVPSVSGMNQDTGAPAAQGGRLPGGRPGQLGQQHRAVRHGGRDLADRPDGARLDHHHPDQQRHPAATASAAARAIPGLPPGAAGIGSTVVEIPGLPPITVPMLGPPPPPPPPPP